MSAWIFLSLRQTRSLKASLIRSVTGGRLSRSRGGAVITALNGDFERPSGGRVALIGHNGAGKSSFLRLVLVTSTLPATSKPIRRCSR